MVVFLHRRASWPQTSIEKVLFDVEYSRVHVFQGGVIECSSRMTGNCQVRFLEGWPPAMGAGYSAHRIDPEAGCETSAHRAPNECMDTLPRTRASPEPMGHHRGVKPGRPPAFCATLKLLAASVVRRRNVPPSSRVSKQWPRSFGLRSDVPSRASFPWPAKLDRSCATD